MALNWSSVAESFRKRVLPAAWTRAVTLSRSAQFELLPRQDSDDEWKLRVRAPSRPVAWVVSLFPADEDAHCNCDESSEPCTHAIAAVLHLKTKDLIAEANPSSDPVSASPKLAKRRLAIRAFEREDGWLCFERVWIDGASATRLIGPLLNSRSQFPLLTPSSGEVELDRFFARESTGVWAPPHAQVEPTLKGLREAGSIEFESPGSKAKTLGIRLDSRGARLRVAPAGEGAFHLRRARDPEILAEFRNGMVLTGTDLHPARTAVLSEIERECLTAQGKVLQPVAYERLATEILPDLRLKLPVDFAPDLDESTLPTAHAAAAPVIDLEISPDPTDPTRKHSIITPRLAYYRPAALTMSGEEELSAKIIRGAAEPAVPLSYPIRDFARERALTQTLGSTLQLKLEFPTRLGNLDVAALKSRAQGLGARIHEVEPGATQFLGTLELHRESLDEGEPLFALGNSHLRSVSARNLLLAHRRGDGFVAVAGGGYAKLPEVWLREHAETLERFLSLRALNSPEEKKTRAAMFAEVLGFPREQVAPSDLPEPSRRLKQIKGVEPRPYQREGISWLADRQGRALGGILADEMGLGKTLQALALLDPGALVAVPRSLIGTWMEAFARHRPDLQAVAYLGTGRALPDRKNAKSAPVILTTHGILARDADLLAEIPFSNFIIDEAHLAKNPSTLLFRAASRISAPFRLALTGTPIENSATDAAALLHLVLPGICGDTVTELRRLPALSLRTLLRAALLRRTKAQVARELPERIETIRLISLSEQERIAYEALLRSTQGQIEEGGEQLSTPKILELLLRLRQTACDPSLVPGLARDPQESSSKLIEARGLVSELTRTDHAILVFSQWTSLLDRFERELRRESISFARIDGSTQDRESQIKTFQDPKGPPVMLLSLKAGGVGLNLTRADHVLLLDPWWNPAAEAQAADRAHRIGQTRTVTVIRMVSSGTIEERVLELQRSKTELARMLLGETDEMATPASSLSRNELIDLIRSEVES